jgi:hypothetical protein
MGADQLTRSTIFIRRVKRLLMPNRNRFVAQRLTMTRGLPTRDL